MKKTIFNKLMMLALLGMFDLVALGAAPSSSSADATSSLSAAESSSVPSLDDQAVELHKQAIELYEAKRWVEALQAFEKLIHSTHDKSRIEARMYIGFIYYRGGSGVDRNWALALENYNKILEESKASARLRAQILLRMGDIYGKGGYGVTKDVNAALIKFRAAALIDKSLEATAIKRIIAPNEALSGKRHGQFIILIDENQEEHLNNDSLAVTRSFASATGLRSSLRAPFLVSRSIVWNFLVRNQRADKQRDSHFIGSVNWELWDIYSVQGTQFLLFFPKMSVKYYSSQLKLATQDVLPLPNNQTDLYNWFKSDVNNQLVQPAERFKPEDLSKVFKRRRDFAPDENMHALMIWDIIIHGHGALESYSPARVGGIPLLQMQKLLKYLNNELYMGVLFIETCSAGGRNSTLLQFEKAVGNTTLLNLNYTVIVGAVSDGVTMISEFSASKWHAFFIKALTESSLGDIIKILGSRRFDHSSGPLEITNIPQVWIPGGYGFQTYSVDERVKILSKALAAAHEDEGRPIIVPETTQVILVYPQEINVPVIIKSPHAVLISMLKDVSGLTQHHFKHIEFEKKDAIAPFLKNISQSNGAAMAIDLLSCVEDPSYRKKLKFGDFLDFGNFRHYQAEPKQLAISAAIQKRLGLPSAAVENMQPNALGASISNALAADVRTGFSIKELYDYGMVPKPLTQNGLVVFNLSSIKNLDSLAGLNTIPGIQDVQILKLFGNQISYIDPEVFAGLTNLQQLWLEYNHITEIGSGAFNGLTNLQQLVLNGNQISKIAPEAFAGLTNLQELSLIGNKIIEIGPGAFKGLTNLQQLALDDNRITVIGPDAFKDLNNLEELWLSNNDIESILPGIFRGLHKLKRLQLNKNKITDIDLESLNDLVALQILDLGDNPISSNTLQQNEIIDKLKVITKDGIKSIEWESEDSDSDEDSDWKGYYEDSDSDEDSDGEGYYSESDEDN